MLNKIKSSGLVMLMVGYLSLNAAPPPSPYGTYEMKVLQGSQTATITITNQPRYGLPTTEYINTEKRFIGAGGLNYTVSPWWGSYDHITKYGPVKTYEYHWQGLATVGEWSMLDGSLGPVGYLYYKSGSLTKPSSGGSGAYFEEGTGRMIVSVQQLTAPRYAYKLYGKLNFTYSVYRSADNKLLATRSLTRSFAYPEQFNQVLCDQYGQPIYKVTEVDLVLPEDKNLNGGMVTIVLESTAVTMAVDTSAPPQ